MSIMQSLLAILTITVPLLGFIFLENTHYPWMHYISPDLNDSVTETETVGNLIHS